MWGFWEILIHCTVQSREKHRQKKKAFLAIVYSYLFLTESYSKQNKIQTTRKPFCKKAKRRCKFLFSVLGRNKNINSPIRTRPTRQRIQSFFRITWLLPTVRMSTAVQSQQWPDQLKMWKYSHDILQYMHHYTTKVRRCCSNWNSPSTRCNVFFFPKNKFTFLLGLVQWILIKIFPLKNFFHYNPGFHSFWDSWDIWLVPGASRNDLPKRKLSPLVLKTK